MSAVISQTDFKGLTLRGRGKVRDIYDLGDRLLIIATDRLSAFDVILPTPIPDKGRVLTQLSLYWFEKLSDVIPHHVIAASNFTGELAPYAESLRLKAARCFAAGRSPSRSSAWSAVIFLALAGRIIRRPARSVACRCLPGCANRTNCLRRFSRHPQKRPPATTENISFEETVSLIGTLSSREKLRDVSLTLYNRASEQAATQNIIIAGHQIRIRSARRRSHLDR